MDPTKYWNLEEHLNGKDDQYMSWEGFTDGRKVLRAFVRGVPSVNLDSEKEKFARDLTLHWIHENIDQAGHTPTRNEVQTVYWFAVQLVDGPRWITKLGDEGEKMYQEEYSREKGK